MDNLRRKFLKDYKSPIPIWDDEPLFEYFVDLYEEHYNTRTNWEMFKGCIKKHDDYFVYSKAVCKEVINAIKSTEAYKSLKNRELIPIVPESGPYPRGIYNDQNVGKYIISIDMHKACYSCMKLTDPELVLNSGTYEEMMSRFTDEIAIIKSKQMRQMIFGMCNPSWQQKMEQNITNELVNRLIREKPDLKIICLMHDEIFIECPPGEDNNEFFNEVIRLVKKVEQEKDLFHFKLFKLGKIDRWYQIDGLPKSAPKHLHAQLYKKLQGLALDERDLKFSYEGFICSFDKPL